MSDDFHDVVDTEGLDPDEAARLRRVHDLLVEAGPPPDLPPRLEHPSGPTDAEIKQFPLLPRRRLAAAVVLAAALAAAAFGIGYLVAHNGGGGGPFEASHVVAMRGPANALASIRIGKEDSAGNWPMEFIVNGLPKQPRGGYYNLYLVKDGKPVVLCGSFRVHDDTTKVRFTVPYEFKHFNGWVVTAQPPGHHEPGPVVLST